MPEQSDALVLISDRSFNLQELYEIQETVRMFTKLSYLKHKVRGKEDEY